MKVEVLGVTRESVLSMDVVGLSGGVGPRDMSRSPGAGARWVGKRGSDRSYIGIARAYTIHSERQKGVGRGQTYLAEHCCGIGQSRRVHLPWF